MNIRTKGGGTTSIPLQEIEKLTFANLTAVGDEGVVNIVRTFALLQNYPNPFNPTTTIEYQLPAVGDVLIRIFSIDGRLVRTLDDGRQGQGVHSVIWDATNDEGKAVATGPYLYRIDFGNSILVRKLLFVK